METAVRVGQAGTRGPFNFLLQRVQLLSHCRSNLSVEVVAVAAPDKAVRGVAPQAVTAAAVVPEVREAQPVTSA